MTDVLYTTTDAIRAAIGVSAIELSDSKITDLDMATLITMELVKVYPAYAAAKTAAEAGGATEAQKLLWQKIKLFCAYQGAVFMLPGLQTILYQTITDGNTTISRFSKDNLQDTKDEIIGMRDYLRGDLNPTDYGGVGLAPKVIVAAVPDFDPVTNTDGI